ATLNVQDGAAVNDITVNPGGSLIVNGGTINSFGNSLFNGSFTQNLASAVSTFFGPATFNGPFNLNNGSLQLGTMTMLAGTNNTWTGGTLGGSGPLVLGLASADGTTLAISGAATKTLDTITLAMNQNDINMSGSGNLSLVNGAVIDNTGGTSFNHSGNGGITGTGTFDNTNGTFNKLSGSAVIAPTVTFINTGSSLVDIAGGALTFVAGGADAGNYSVRSAGTLAFTNGKTLAAGSTLNLAGNLVVGNGLSPTTLTLPGTLNNTGNIQLNNARLDLTNLGGTLSLTGGARLGGSGTVAGNLVNANGVIVVGGAGTLGNLAISGSYDQGANSAIVVEAFNNGFTTVFDQLTIGGPSTLNGGTLVIGFTTNSLGLVTANFSPITASSGVSGGFSRIIDAGGNILFINFNSGVFTILGASPKIPDKVIDDLISFLKKNGEQLAEEIARNRSQAEAIIEALLKEEAPGQDGLVCN
ncbi:MAG: hypothetical protein OEN02_05340, partial [Gammaproteobacteria bacterium]|nr:hypothetical protein [Gammaproteobacteria bacterium]